jgi:transcriptional regulator with XRE-family HTH domain
MAPKTESRWLYQILGANLRAMRKDLGWSQDELARRARTLGLHWSRSSVAAFETGKKPIHLQDLLLLLVLLRTSVGELLVGDSQIGLSKSVTLALEDVRALLTTDGLKGEFGQESDSPAQPVHAAEGDLNPARTEADDVWLIWISNAKREAEQKAARKVGVPVDDFVAMAFRRWGQSLTDERDARAEAAVNQIDSSRGLQASRGHITRQLLQELEPQIQNYLENARRR